MSWAAKYDALVRIFDIPDRDYDSNGNSGSSVEVRGLSLNLSNALSASRATLTRLYADTVTTTNSEIYLPAYGGVNIITRIFLADASTNVTLRCDTGPAAFVLYTLALRPGTSFQIISSSSTLVFQPEFAADDIGCNITIGANGDIKAQTTSYIDANEFKQDNQLHRLLRSQFCLSAAWFYSFPSDSADILRFISTLTASSEFAAEIRMQAITLLTQQSVRGDAAEQGLTYVPRLDQAAYEVTVRAYLDVADAFESQYDRYVDLAAGQENWIAAATDMLNYHTDIAVMGKDLVSQAQARYESAETALAQNSSTFEDCNTELQKAEALYKEGYRAWVVAQMYEVALGVMEAIFSLGVAVAGAAMGNPGAAEAAASAAKAAEEGHKAAEAVAEAGSSLEKLLAGLKKLPELMKKMADIGKVVNTVVASIQKAINVAHGGAVTDLEAPDSMPNFIAALASWDVFLDELEVSMKFPISQEIKGAEEYRLASRKMAIFGKALLLTNVALVNQGEELARLIMQQRVNEGEQTRLEERIQQLGLVEDAYRAVQVILFNRLLDVRGWIFLFLQSYVDSHHYWALKSSSVVPSMIKRVADYRSDLATLSRELIQAYDSFNPPPQTFTHTVSSEDGENFLTDGVLTSLRDTGNATFHILVTEDVFWGYSRVRIDTIRVYLEGINGTTSNPVHLRITNDGTYIDKSLDINPEPLSFCSDFLQRSFKYVDKFSDPVMDGDVAIPSKYFTPTPFSKWNIEMGSEFNPNNLTGITMIFIGSAVVYARAIN